MTWQEQLRQLDAAFAAGKVSADVYRRQRDDLLASAQSGQSAAPQQPHTGPDSNPFPAPFKWSPQQPQQASSSESTQFIKPVGAPDEAERTQVVPGSGAVPPVDAAERTQVVSNADRTQVVRGQQQQGAPWQAQQQQQGTPWGGADQYSPPWAGGDAEQQQWSGFNTQGPEVFDESGGGKGKVFAIVGIVVVVLAIAAGVYFFAIKPSGGETVASDPTSSVAPTTTTKPKPSPFGTLVVPEGRSAGPKTYTPEELATAKPLPTPDLVVLKQVGATEARSVIVVENEITTSLWAFKAGSPAALQEAMDTDQKRFGFVEDPDAKQGSIVPFKSVQTSADKSITVFRAHYVAGGEVIRTEVFSVDEASARKRFDEVFAEQLKHTAPTK